MTCLSLLCFNEKMVVKLFGGSPRFSRKGRPRFELEARRVRQEAQLMRRQCVQETVNGPTVVGCFRPVTCSTVYQCTTTTTTIIIMIIVIN